MSKTSLVSVSAAVLVAATGCTAETVSSIDDDVTALISVDPPQVGKRMSIPTSR